MRSCIDFVLSERSSFEFAQMFLGNKIENICHTGSLEQGSRTAGDMLEGTKDPEEG